MQCCVTVFRHYIYVLLLAYLLNAFLGVRPHSPAVAGTPCTYPDIKQAIYMNLEAVFTVSAYKASHRNEYVSSIHNEH